MSLRTENTQLRQEVHNVLAQFRAGDTEMHVANNVLRRQVAELRHQARQFLAQCHDAREKQRHDLKRNLQAQLAELKAQVAAWRAAARAFIWGDGAPRTKGQMAAAAEQEPAPRPPKKKRHKAKAN